MNTYRNILFAVIAVMAVIGGAAVLTDDSFCAEPAGPETDQPSAEPAETVLDHIETSMSQGGRFSPVCDYDGNANIIGSRTISGPLSLKGVNVLKDGTVLEFTDKGILELADGARLVIDGTVTFVSEGPFSIILHNGSSIDIGGTTVFRCEDPLPGYDSAMEIRSTGKMVMGYEFRDKTAEGAEDPFCMDYYTEVYVDAVSEDEADVPSICILSRYTLSADTVPDASQPPVDTDAVTAYAISKLPGDVREISMTSAVEMSGTYHDIEARFPDVPYTSTWFFDYMGDGDAVAPSVNCTLYVAPIAVEHCRDAAGPSGAPEVIRMVFVTEIRAAAVNMDQMKGLDIEVLPLSVTIADYLLPDGSVSEEPCSVSEIEDLEFGASLYDRAAVYAETGAVKVQYSSGDTRMQLQVSSEDLDILFSPSEFVDELAYLMTGSPVDYESYLEFVTAPGHEFSDIFADTVITSSVSDMHLELEQEKDGSYSKVVWNESSELILNLSDNDIADDTGLIVSPGMFCDSVTGFSAVLSSGITGPEGSMSETEVSMAANALNMNGGFDKHHVAHIFAYLMAAVPTVSPEAPDQAPEAQSEAAEQTPEDQPEVPKLQQIVTDIIGLIMQGVDVGFQYEASDASFGFEQFTGTCDEASAETGYIPSLFWNTVDSEQRYSMKAETLAVVFSLDTVIGPGPEDGDCPDGSLMSAFMAEKLYVSGTARSQPVAVADGQASRFTVNDTAYYTADSMKVGGIVNIIDLFAPVDPEKDPTEQSDLFGSADASMSVAGYHYMGMSDGHSFDAESDSYVFSSKSIEQTLDSLELNLLAKTEFQKAEIVIGGFDHAVSDRGTVYHISGEPAEGMQAYDVTSYEMSAVFNTASLGLHFHLDTSVDGKAASESAATFLNSYAFNTYVSALLADGDIDPAVYRQNADGLVFSADLLFESEDVSADIFRAGSAEQEPFCAEAGDISGMEVRRIAHPDEETYTDLTLDGMDLGMEFNQDSAAIHAGIDRLQFKSETTADGGVLYDDIKTKEIGIENVRGDVTVSNEEMLYILTLAKASVRKDTAGNAQDASDVNRYTELLREMVEENSNVSVSVQTDVLTYVDSEMIEYKQNIPYNDDHPDFIADEGENVYVRFMSLSVMGKENNGAIDPVVFKLERLIADSAVFPGTCDIRESMDVIAPAGARIGITSNSKDMIPVSFGSLGYAPYVYSDHNVSATVEDPEISLSVTYRNVDPVTKDVTPDENTIVGLKTVLADAQINVMEGEQLLYIDMSGIQMDYAGNLLCNGGFSIRDGVLVGPEIMYAEQMDVSIIDSDSVRFADVVYEDLFISPSYDMTDGTLSYVIDAGSVSGEAGDVSNAVNGDRKCLTGGSSMTMDGDVFTAVFGSVDVSDGSTAELSGTVDIRNLPESIRRLISSMETAVSDTCEIDGTAVPEGTRIDVGERFTSVTVDGTTYLPGQSVVLHAGDSAVTSERHAVIQDLGDGRTVTSYFDAGEKAVLAVPEREGHSFAGWVDETGAPFEDFTMGGEDVRVSAVWEVRSYRFSVDPDGGVLETEPVSEVPFGETVFTPMDCEASKEGYVLTGWMQGTRMYSPGEGFDMPACDVAVKAVWNTPVSADDVRTEGTDAGFKVVSDSADISAEAVGRLTADGVENVRLVLGSASVDMTKDGLNTLTAGQGIVMSITSGDSLSFDTRVDLENAPYKGLAMVINVNVRGTAFPDVSQHYGLGDVTVTMPFDASGMILSHLAVIYASENGHIVEIDDFAYDDERKEISFVTDHFSTFAVAEREVPVSDITVEQSPNGTVAVSPAGQVEADTEVTVTVIPDHGYRLKALMFGDITVEAVEGQNVYRFEMPIVDVLVKAEFEAVPTFDVVIGGIEHGTVTAYPGSAVVPGDIVTLTVIPDAGYRLVSLTVGGNAVAVEDGRSVYTFAMPAGSTAVTAEFEDTLPGPEAGSKEGYLVAGTAAALAILLAAAMVILRRQ